MTDTVSNAVAKRQEQEKIAGFLTEYQPQIAEILPSHVKPETFLRLAVGVFRRDEKLLEAARNDPLALVEAMLHAARKGLEPGTEQFYLVPRKSKQHGGRTVIQGIEGYQGIVERIYRAGAAASVVVEAVREHDVFVWKPGGHDTAVPKRWEGPQVQPYHEVDWFGEDRGKLIGVYSYAVMRDSGAISKVVVLNRARVMEAKAKSDGAKSEYSPWNTHEEAMWLKTAARRLEKWVPTSNEVRNLAQPPQAMAPAVPTAMRRAGHVPSDVDAPLQVQATIERTAPDGGWPEPAKPGGASDGAR